VCGLGVSSTWQPPWGELYIPQLCSVNEQFSAQKFAFMIRQRSDAWQRTQR
jgi:hypothetical protein